MTEASTGLRKALARGQSVNAAALAALSAEELIAGLSADQKAAVAAAHAAEAETAASNDEDGDTTKTGDGKKPKAKKKEDNDMAEEAEASAKAATDRALAVMASEHFAGRDKLAATLLANDKLSATEIVTVLAAAAPVAAPAKAEDDETKARAAMQAALAAEQPGPTGQAADEPKAVADNGWADVHAEVALERGLATK